ncbi:tyrosine-type recombinase/integrase [Pseudomonas sp. GCM10022186]|uniref:tyrosine-type recombinase/integrase n=1 Tax=Pseudomonas sp. GCM10022186 TaxID=3252650 RepID=UPI0036110F18
MKVLAVRAKALDLSESPTLGEGGSGEPLVVGAQALTGAGVFDDEERLLPLVSGFLSHEFRNGLMSYQSGLTYGKNLGYFHEYLMGRREFAGCERDLAYLEARTHVLEEYFAHLREIEELSEKTVRNRDSSLMAFFNKYLCRGVDDVPAPREAPNPYFNGLLTRRPNSKLVQACTLADLKQLILATESERERCLLQFIYDTGIRRSEVPRVTLAAIDDALNFQNTLFISPGVEEPINADYCPLYIAGSKGLADKIKPRTTLVCRATLQRVRKYHSSPLYKMYRSQFGKAEETPAFLNAEGTSYTPNSVTKLLDRVSERALAKMRIAKKISPHKLRHGNAYSLLRSPDIGKDHLDRLVAVQKSLGHARLSTSEIYTQIPYDLYQKLLRPGSESKTKAGEMEELVKQTRLRIDAGAVK